MGLDWAKEHHDVVVVDPAGRIVLDLRIEHTADGWRKLHRKLADLAGGDPSVVAVAIETSHGPAVERLLELGCTVYPLNPKAAKSYRSRKAPSGTKTDRLDAFSFADALRTDGHGWRPLRAEDPRVQELRLLCRDEVTLIGQRTAWVNQLQAALNEYYPAALKAFDDWTLPAAWAFIERFPTPEKLVKAGKRYWEKFLHTHKLYRPQTYAKRLAIFAHAAEFCGPEAVTRAKSRLAVTLAKQLRILQAQLAEYRAAIEQLFSEHPDHDLFGSLPGAGVKLAPRLLAECGDDRGRFDDAQALQCYAGTAPISFQSGQIHQARFRRACSKPLRNAVHFWANGSRKKCAWAAVYYTRKREQGKSHACALRCLGQRWLAILWKMIQTGRPYDEALHTRNQLAHGSWCLQLATTQTPAKDK
jgi:transposase